MNSETLARVLAGALNINASVITDDLAADSVETWTSLNHLTLVISLEEAFDVSFTEEETVEILSVKSIKSALRHHGVEV